MSFPKYPKYKDSGVEWLGDVPKHWTIASVRRIIRRIEQGWSPECYALTAEAERGIELLQERRTALISAAVTGKIYVLELASS